MGLAPSTGMAKSKTAAVKSPKSARKPAQKQQTAPTRSPKAPALRDAELPKKAQARRRQPSAVTLVRKDSTVMQTDRGPRAAWSASKPMFQKR